MYSFALGSVVVAPIATIVPFFLRNRAPQSTTAPHPPDASVVVRLSRCKMRRVGARLTAKPGGRRRSAGSIAVSRDVAVRWVGGSRYGF
jgi:hypothetical protein